MSMAAGGGSDDVRSTGPASDRWRRNDGSRNESTAATAASCGGGSRPAATSGATAVLQSEISSRYSMACRGRSRECRSASIMCRSQRSTPRSGATIAAGRNSGTAARAANERATSSGSRNRSTACGSTPAVSKTPSQNGSRRQIRGSLQAKLPPPGNSSARSRAASARSAARAGSRNHAAGIAAASSQRVPADSSSRLLNRAIRRDSQ